MTISARIISAHVQAPQGPHFSGLPTVSSLEFQNWIAKQWTAYDEGNPAFISPTDYHQLKVTVSGMLTDLWGSETATQFTADSDFATHLIPPSLYNRQTKNDLKRIQATCTWIFSSASPRVSQQPSSPPAKLKVFNGCAV